MALCITPALFSKISHTCLLTYTIYLTEESLIQHTVVKELKMKKKKSLAMYVEKNEHSTTKLVNNQKLQPTGFKSSFFHLENTDKNNILLL